MYQLSRYRQLFLARQTFQCILKHFRESARAFAKLFSAYAPGERMHSLEISGKLHKCEPQNLDVTGQNEPVPDLCDRTFSNEIRERPFDEVRSPSRFRHRLRCREPMVRASRDARL